MADTLKTLKCPACGKEMEKVFIQSVGINLDICTQGCGGIYFDNREFKHFDEKNDDISAIIEKLKNKTFEKVNSNADRFCPNCSSKMVKNHSSIKQNIEIDECYNCGGKFLDNDELIKIREEYDTEEERSEDAFVYLYKQIGAELAAQDKRYAEIKQSKLRTLFNKLTGL
ncbi:MAG: zf-TFIIB domain-containing protein [Muribaculaceae bacterium]|nr:zf-TFIIB domain-containing protein [Muribaculaceae bacterium]